MLKRVALASVLALLLCGCGPDVIQLSEVDNGKTIACSKGDQLVITLPANPTTGFTWQVYRQPSSEHLVLTRSEFNETPGSRNMVGVPGTYSFFIPSPAPAKKGSASSTAVPGRIKHPAADSRSSWTQPNKAYTHAPATAENAGRGVSLSPTACRDRLAFFVRGRAASRAQKSAQRSWCRRALRFSAVAG